jgi:hypothetical protein
MSRFEYNKERRISKAKSGVCYDCTLLAVPGGKYCAAHQEKQNQRLSRSRERNENKCYGCKAEIVATKGWCAKCLEEKKEIRKTRKRDSLCVVCGKQTTGHVECVDCKERRKQNRQKVCGSRASLGLCYKCGLKDRVGNIGMCSECALKSFSRDTFGTTARYGDLQKLFDSQNGICPYTGTELVIGINASVDHKIPKSQGGSNDLGNLQWVYLPVNMMKHKYKEEEFLDIVKLIYKHKELGGK